MEIIYILLISIFIYFSNAQKLSSYNIDRSKITVSGISAGGAMAAQLHVAYSATIKGAGIVAGPPYSCSGGSLMGATLCMNTGVSSFTNIWSTIETYVSKGQADPTSNLRGSRVYNYHGSKDFTVAAASAKKNDDFYRNYAVQLKSVYSYASAHGFITNNFGTACGTTNSQNYMNNCDYNQAYDILKHMYDLIAPEPAKDSKAQSSLKEFSQTEFFSSGTQATISMDSTGYVYVPRNCENGAVCKLHVALHGCLQGKYKIGSTFAENTGFNQVADANDIIILYPQAVSSLMSNPNGCWDWWGYINANYANKQGPQMSAIKGMIDRLAAGSTSIYTQATTTTQPATTASTTSSNNGGLICSNCICNCKNANGESKLVFKQEL